MNTPICVIISLTTFADRRNSPLSGRPSASSRMLCVRSPLRDGGDRARHFGGGPQQIVDERVDGGFHLAPRAGAALAGDANARLAFLADHLSGALELVAMRWLAAHHLIECVGDLAAEAGLVRREAHAEIAVAHRLQAPAAVS